MSCHVGEPRHTINAKDFADFRSAAVCFCIALTYVSLMLAKNLFAAVALAALTLPVAGCSDPAADQDRPKVIDSVRVALPFGDDDAEFDNSPALAINADGEFALNGNAVSPDQFAAYLSEQEEEETAYLSVQIDEDAKVGDVIALLSPVAEETPVYVAQAGLGNFRRGQVKLTDPILDRLFVGRIGDYHLPLIASHLSQEDQCVLLLGGGGASILQGRSLGASELGQVATKFLQRYVEHHGGPEAVAKKPDVVSTIVARIQATAETPWRCVAGPMERAGETGWPNLQYELVP